MIRQVAEEIFEQLDNRLEHLTYVKTEEIKPDRPVATFTFKEKRPVHVRIFVREVPNKTGEKPDDLVVGVNIATRGREMGKFDGRQPVYRVQPTRPVELIPWDIMELRASKVAKETFRFVFPPGNEGPAEQFEKFLDFIAERVTWGTTVCFPTVATPYKGTGEGCNSCAHQLSCLGQG